MNRDQKITDIIRAVADLPRPQQLEYLDSACKDDAELRAEVESRLNRDGQKTLTDDPLRRDQSTDADTMDFEQTIPANSRSESSQFASSTQFVGTKPAIDLPGYEILEEIGRGGLGVVFKAQQLALGRVVAVKMMLPNTFPGSKELERFRLEAAAVAQLQHPNVVQVFDVIDREDNPCLCMEYVAGGNLSDQLDGRPQPPKSAAELVEILARAMHAVHEVGYLHRDLKPANILLSASDADTAVELAGENATTESIVPKITDFGLVKQLGADSNLTATGAAFGTPSYMSPEQARESKTVTRAADIYSLGAILYELLVGRPPFRGLSIAETIQQVLHEPPIRPRRLVSAITADLEAVCLKCLEKEPSRRYDSAEALADDLRRVQNGLPTIARPTTSLESGWRLCKRNPAVASLVALAFLLLLVGTGVSTIFGIRAVQKASDAKQSEQSALTNAQLAHEEVEHARDEHRRANEFAYSSAMRLLQFSVESGNFQAAQSQLFALEQIEDNIDRRGFEWYYWTNLLRQQGEPLRLREKSAGVLRPQFSSDRKLLASVDEQGALFIWNAQTGALLQRLDAHQGAIDALRFSPDAKQIVTLRSEESRVKIWDTASGELQTAFPADAANKGPLLNAWFDAQGRPRAAIRNQNKDGVEVWDVEKNQLAFNLEKMAGFAVKVVFGDDGVLLVDVRGEDLHLFDASTGKLIRKLSRSGIGARLESAGFSSDQTLMAAGIGRRIHVWNIKSGRLLQLLPRHTSSFESIHFAADNEHIICWDASQHIRVWATSGDLVSYVLQDRLVRGKRSGMTLSKDGERLADSNSTFGRIDIWDTAPFSSREEIKLGEQYRTAGLSRSSQHVALAKNSGEVEVVDWATRETIFRCLPSSPADQVVLSPDGRRLAANTGAGNFQIWNLLSTDPEPIAVAADSSPSSACFSPNGKLFAAAAGMRIRLWDPETGTEVQSLEGHTEECASVAFHPKGKVVASGAMNRDYQKRGGYDIENRENETFRSSILLWDVNKGEIIADLSRPNTAVGHLCFDPDGSTLASTSKNLIDLYDVKNQTLIRTLVGHAGEVFALSFSPDGQRLASSAGDKTVRIWDVSNGQELLTLHCQQGGMTSVEFNSDGTKLFGKSRNRLVVWRASRE